MGTACDASTAADSQAVTLKETPNDRSRSSMSLGFLRTGRSAWLPTHKKRESTVLCPSMSRTSAQVYTVLRKKQTKHHAWNSKEIAPQLRNLLNSENSRILLRTQIRPRNMKERVFVM
jgi:hypothetical protein